jgi:NitT/TauT family transport system permease protein
MLSSILNGTDNLPGVVQIGKACFELFSDGTLLRYSVASLFRVTVGFYLAALLAIPLGIYLGRRKRIGQWVNPIIQFLRPVSPLAWIPFAMIWFGIGDRPALFIIFMASFFPILLTTISAAAMIPNMYFQVAANLQFNTWENLCYVILPATMPSIVLALRVALGIAWMVVVAAEMIAVKSGLGFLIVDARNALRIDYVIVAIMIIGGIGLLLDHTMTQLERIGSVRWRFEQN